MLPETLIEKVQDRPPRLITQPPQTGSSLKLAGRMSMLLIWNATMTVLVRTTFDETGILYAIPPVACVLIIYIAGTIIIVVVTKTR